MAEARHDAGRASIAFHRRAVVQAMALLAAAPALASPIATPLAARQEAPPPAPDFSAVTTRTAAGRLVRKRVLVKIHFFPPEFGGPRTRYNIGYVTPEAAAAHAQLVDALSRYIEYGLVDQLEIEPEYRGDSVVPARIRMIASHSRGGKRYERVIEIWGCGLCVPYDPLPDPDARESIKA